MAKKKKVKYIKPLNEDEYTDIEVNSFSDCDELSDEVISLGQQATYDEAPIRIFSFNQSEGNNITNSSTHTISETSQIFNNVQTKDNSNNLNKKDNSNTLNKKDNSINTKDNSNILEDKFMNQMNPPTSKLRGLTPPIDGETFSVKRCYQFRPSTLKKLNQLKGESDNFNIYLNEIIDQAICYYHDSVFNKK